eukprot:492134-Rhodomonas_salina.2
MPGTEIAYGARRGGRGGGDWAEGAQTVPYALLARYAFATRCPVLASRMLLRVRYALSGAGGA